MTPEKDENYADNLRILRAAGNLSKTEFAKALGIPKSTLRAIPEDSQTTRISEKLSVTPDIPTRRSLTGPDAGRLKLLTQKGKFYKRTNEAERIALPRLFMPIRTVRFDAYVFLLVPYQKKCPITASSFSFSYISFYNLFGRSTVLF